MVMEIVKLDSVPIFTHFRDLKHTLGSLVYELVRYTSVNIIEWLRFKIDKRTDFEKMIVNKAYMIYNERLIQHCEEHDYGNH